MCGMVGGDRCRSRRRSALHRKVAIATHREFRCAGSRRVAMDQSDLAAADNSSTVMKNYQHERTQGAGTLRQVSRAR